MSEPRSSDGYVDVRARFLVAEQLRAWIPLLLLSFFWLLVGSLTVSDRWDIASVSAVVVLGAGTVLTMVGGRLRWSRLRRAADAAMLASDTDVSVIFTDVVRRFAAGVTKGGPGFLTVDSGHLQLHSLRDTASANPSITKPAHEIVTLARVNRLKGSAAPILVITWDDEEWRFALQPQTGRSVGSATDREVDMLIHSITTAARRGWTDGPQTSDGAEN